MMLQQVTADDFVIATGKKITMKEFAQLAFQHTGLDWEEHVGFDERYLRPAEVDQLLDDPTKAKENFGWMPETSDEESLR